MVTNAPAAAAAQPRPARRPGRRPPGSLLWSAARTPRASFTQIPTVPRRWFASARFDHQAHRNLSCVECHAGAETSKETADVLSPDFDGGMAGLPPAEGKPAVVAAESCLKCHGAGQPNLPAALSACIVCHDYHQHQNEVWPAGRNVPRTKTAMPVKSNTEQPTAQPAEPAA